MDPKGHRRQPDQDLEPRKLRLHRGGWHDAISVLATGANAYLEEIDGHRLLVFHSTPWQPRGEYLTPNHKRFRELGTLGYDIIIHGRTHWQYAGKVGNTLVIDPGSDGEPRDHRNGPRGSVAIPRHDIARGYASILMCQGCERQPSSAALGSITST